MTVADWVAQRMAGAPGPLVAAVREATGSSGSRPAADAGSVLLACAEERLARFLPHGVQERDGATELLVIDALTTLALEAAADDPGVGAWAGEAVRRLAAVAGAA